MKLKYPKIKICCISSVEEAEIAIEAGADALGLVSGMPSGPGVISEDLITEIIKTVPPCVETFLLTSATRFSEIADQVTRLNPTVVQLVDYVEHSVYTELKEKFPLLKIVQVLHVQSEDEIKMATVIERMVDAILLDSGNPNAEIKILGGTGNTHNWEISKKIVNSVNVPVFLAGGLNTSNVFNAVIQVGSYGLDICSGVRTEGKLDKEKVTRLIEIAKLKKN